MHTDHHRFLSISVSHHSYTSSSATCSREPLSYVGPQLHICQSCPPTLLDPIKLQPSATSRQPSATSRQSSSTPRLHPQTLMIGNTQPVIGSVWLSYCSATFSKMVGHSSATLSQWLATARLCSASGRLLFGYTQPVLSFSLRKSMAQNMALYMATMAHWMPMSTHLLRRPAPLTQ